MAWTADLVQAVVFTQPGPVQPDALKLWSHLFKDEGPDNFQRPTSSPISVTTASGQRDGRKLTITAQLGRIDLFYQPSVVDKSMETRPSISDFQAACRSLTEYTILICSEVTATRLAIVLNLSESIVAGREARTLKKLTGVNFPDASTDCSYQFNLRKPFASAASIPMNRLCTWTSAEHQLISLSGDGSGQNPMTLISQPVVGLKIDVNTAPAVGIDQKLVGHMFKELAEEIIKISETGIETHK